jgi:hypothetical protein
LSHEDEEVIEHDVPWDILVWGIGMLRKEEVPVIVPLTVEEEARDVEGRVV